MKQTGVRLLVFGVLVAGMAVAEPVDYPTARKAAAALAKAGRYENALKAFQQMGETANTDDQKADAFEQAAMCAVRLKDNARATQLAARIPLKPNANVVRMRILAKDRKYAELIERYGTLDVSTWPRPIAGEALVHRGRAHAALRQGEPAAAALEQAVDWLPANTLRSEAQLGLAQTYAGLLKDAEKALGAYQNLIAMETRRDRGGWKYYSGIIGAAGLQSRQGKHAEALATLAAVDVAKTKGYWHVAMLVARGEVHAAAGRTKQAVVAFTKALAEKGIAAHHKKRCEQRLSELQGRPANAP